MNENKKIAELIYEKIKIANNILIISSRPADQDCVGSTLSLRWWISEEFGKKAKPVIFAGITDRLINFPNAKEVEFVNLDLINLNEYDLIITVDGSAWSRVFTDRNYKSALGILDLNKVVSIDHHQSEDIKSDLKDYSLTESTDCTCHLIYDYFIKPSGKKVTPEVATWMLLALIDDTKRFQHEVYSSTFDFAKELIDAGGDYLLATDESSPIENIKFTAWAIDNTEFVEEVQSTFLIIDQRKSDELELRFGRNWNKKDYDRHYVETVLRKINGYNYGFLIQKGENGIGCRIGWRTRNYGDNASIKDILNSIGFKAGGHFGAGGGFSDIISVEEAKEMIIRELKLKN